MQMELEFDAYLQASLPFEETDPEPTTTLPVSPQSETG